MIKLRGFLWGIILLFLGGYSLHAQDVVLRASTVGSGAGASMSVTHQVQSTLGPVASPVDLTNAAHGHRVGFWFTVQRTAYPATMRIAVRRTFGEASSPQDYALVALPGALERPLAQLFDGAPGVDWQAFWDDGSAANFLRSYDGSEVFTFEPGRGFWLISTAPWAVDATVNTVPLNAGLGATVPLHGGWNIISNPLDRDIDWTAVRSANGDALQILWAWDGAFASADTFRSAAAGDAYYFLNDQGFDELLIPYRSGSLGSGVPPQKSRRDGRPTLELIATQEEARSAVRVGFAPDADVGLDPRDQFAPPGRFEAVSLRLMVPAAAASPRMRYLAHEWRPAGQGQTFELILRSNDGPVTLTAVGVETLGSHTASLIDVASGRAYDLHDGAVVRWNTSPDSARLRLAVGSEAFVAEEVARVMPQEVALQPAYPNPSPGRVMLTYAVPRASEVRVVIYDVLGRRVRTMVDRMHQPGRYQRVWDGRNGGGERVASGVYLVRLTAGGQQHVQKVALVR